ncbi:hypothetical protein GX441_10235 [bacterium]|nr:hypothetical protein [bacterium]
MKNKLIWLWLIAASQLLAWSVPATIASAGKNFFPQIVSDGSTGAIISWIQKNTSDCYEVYARHVDANGNTGTSYPVSVRNDVTVGHRLNHHIVWGGSSAYCFWVNHFNTALENDLYPKGYYLQKLSSSGTPQWPNLILPNPVQVKNISSVPSSSLEEDGDPISVCPAYSDEGCIVAMKYGYYSSGSYYNCILVNRFDNGTAQWGNGTEVYTTDPTDFTTGGKGDIVGCPKIVQWNGKYMVIYATATHAVLRDTFTLSETKLHLQPLTTSGTKETEYVSTFSSIPSTPSYFGKDRDWFWIVPEVDVTVSPDGLTIYAAYLKRLKRKWSNFDAPACSYREDHLYVLRCTSSGITSNLEIDKWVVPYNFAPPIDELPLRAPSIACLSTSGGDDGAVVVYPRAKPGACKSFISLEELCPIC